MASPPRTTDVKLTSLVTSFGPRRQEFDSRFDIKFTYVAPTMQEGQADVAMND